MKGFGHNLGVDLLRVICIFGVVLIHSPRPDEGCYRAVLHWFPNVNAFFALLAGWFMVRNVREVKWKEWIGKRFWRLMVPYFVWEGTNIVLHFLSQWSVGRFPVPTFSQWLEYLFLGECSMQLWFVCTLFYVQMTIGGAACFLVRDDRSRKMFCLGGLVVALVLIAAHTSLPLGHVRKTMFVGGFCLLGLVARDLLGACRGVHRSVWVGVWALSALAIVNGWMRWVSLPLAVNVGSWCVCFGLSGKVLEPLLTEKDNGLLRAWAKGVMCLGGFVMSVYLAHWIVIRIFVEPMQPFVVRTLGTGCCALLLNTTVAFGISVGVAYAMRKVWWVWGMRKV